MSDGKSISIDDQNGSIVTAIEAPYSTSVRLLISRLGDPGSTEWAQFTPHDAKRLGGWLVAWAAEQGPDCCYCHQHVLRSDAKAIGQEFAHQHCIDEQWKRGRK